VKKSDIVFTEDIHKDTYAKNFEYLQEWRDLSDRAQQLPSHFDALLRIVINLETALDSANASMKNFLSGQKSMLVGLKGSSEVLQRRIEGVIGLVSDI
jgi:hypothetical protein